MGNNDMAGGLVQTWVPVTDTDGRAHLEAHWVDPSAVDHSVVAHVTHAA